MKPNDEAPKRRRHRDAEAGADLLAELGLDDAAPKQDDRRRRRDDDRRDDFEPRRRRRVADGPKSEDVVRDLDDILATLPSQEDADDDKRRDETEDNEYRHSRGRNDRRGRRMRGRDRDYDERDERRGRGDRNDRNDRNDRADRMDRNADRDQRNDRMDRADRDQHRDEPKEDLVPVAGIVDVLDSYAFVRTSGYLPGPNDVYVSMGQVKKYGLRKGDAVHGSIRAPREGERRNQRQKFVPLQSIDSINGMSVEEAQHRPQFSKLTPLYPQERLKQETTPNKLTGRLIDIVAPIGKGQRGLIVSPPKAGKTITLQNIAQRDRHQQSGSPPDGRPRGRTSGRGHRHGTHGAGRGHFLHLRPSGLRPHHRRRTGHRTRQASRGARPGRGGAARLHDPSGPRYNIAAPASGRILSGGVDAQALYPPKKFFGAARNIENGGSLTIISSALVEPAPRWTR